jgi:hypothetical protein
MAAGGWSAWGLLTDSGGGLCPSEVPAALATAWHLPSPSGCSPGSAAYAEYASGRFGFRVLIPASFVPDAPPADGDGLLFRSPDRHATVTAGGGENVNAKPPGQLLASLEASYQGPGGTVTYHSHRGHVIALSGTTSSGRVFYVRDIVHPTYFYGLTWSYPHSAQASYGPMVTETAESFIAGPASGS